MAKVISYIHLIGCIGWSLFMAVLLVHEPAPGDLVGILITIALFATTLSGIYLFFVGRNGSHTKLQELKVENSILENQVKQKELKQKLEEK